MAARAALAEVNDRAVIGGNNPPPEFRLTEKQDEQYKLIGGEATHCLDFGGARGGKTFGFVHPIVTRALAAPGSRHLICRFRFNAVKRSVRLDTFPKVMKLAFPGVRWKPHDQDGYVTLGEDAQIWFAGLDNQERIDKILGTEYATIFANEVSEIPYETVLALRTRLAQKVLIKGGPKHGTPLRRRMYYDLNPTSRKHWTHREFIDHVSPIDGSPLNKAHAADFGHMKTSPGDNAANLDPAFIASLANLPRLQRLRFYDGNYLTDVEGALWRSGMFRRVSAAGLPGIKRKVVAIDPSGAKHAKDISADEIGIIVAGLGFDDCGYILEDLSLRAGPAAWASLAVAAYRRHQADAIVVESNYGGPMSKALIHSIDKNVNVKMVTASSGKHVRAEPIAGLYEQGRVRHVGGPEDFEALEDQLMQFTVAGYMGPGSPDRGDALVWALFDLMITQAAPATATAMRSHGR